MDQQKEEKDVKPFEKEDELIQSIQEIKDVLNKFFIFFQGL